MSTHEDSAWSSLPHTFHGIPLLRPYNAPESIQGGMVDLSDVLPYDRSKSFGRPSNDIPRQIPPLCPQIASQVVLAEKARQNTYHLCHAIPGVINGQDSLTVPVVLDTEFWQHSWPTLMTGQEAVSRQGVTVQMCGALAGSSMIFVHPHYEKYTRERGLPLRHPVLQTGFAPVDYLAALGFDIQLKRNKDRVYVNSLPQIQFVIYAYFAVAELYLMVMGKKYLKDLDQAVHVKAITMQRRLLTKSSLMRFAQDHTPMPWVATLNGYPYGVEICILDIGAIHGTIGYKRFAANSDIDLPDKDSMHDLGLIACMHEAYQTHPAEYDAYSEGDLRIYKAVVNNARNIGRIYSSLGLFPYYRGEPRLTIGATVRDIFLNKILQVHGIQPNETEKRDTMLDQLVRPASAAVLRKRTDSTAALLSKVQGGRCRNNQPTLLHLTGALVDMDLKGCYGEGQRNQLYPFGKPLIIDYPADSPHNKYLTLRQFLKLMQWGKASCELVPGLWHTRVSIASGTTLQYPQDYLESWFNFSIKDIAEKPFDPHITDLDGPEWELDVRTGTLKILMHEIHNAVITHDYIQWLYNVASAPQREELLDSLFIHAAMLYPASQRVQSLDELNDRIANHKGQNRCIVRIDKGLMTKVSVHQECYAWFAVNMGECIIDDIMAYRALHPKGTPLNELYKLVTNTLYGDVVSPYFPTSNVIVGNNITARARCAEWLLEKGLNAVQSITDGGMFDINRVVYPLPHRRITAQSTIRLYKVDDPSKRNIKLAPLGGYDHIDLEWENGNPILHCYRNDTVETKSGKAAMAWVDAEAMRHLQKLFPGMDVLHAPTKRLLAHEVDGVPKKEFVDRQGQFDFEGKQFWNSATFYAAANYRFVRPDEVKVVMRSYPKRKDLEYYTTRLENGKLLPADFYDDTDPPSVFLTSLEHAEKVERANVFVRRGILKPRAYLQRYHAAYQYSPLRPGDTIYQVGLLREFSLAQFTFNTLEQYKAIHRQYERSKAKWGQYVEKFFTYDDGTLNFQEMVNVVNNLICQGSMDLLKDLGHRKNHLRIQSYDHPALETFTATREFAKEIQGFPTKITPKIVEESFSSQFDDTLNFIEESD